MMGEHKHKTVIARLMGYMVQYKGLFLASMILMSIEAVLNASMPLIMGLATNAIMESDLQALGMTFKLLILVALLLFATGWAGQRLIASISQQALYDLRNGLFAHIQELSLNFFDRQPIGELMSRLSNDIDVIDQFFSNGFQQVVQSILTIVIVSILMIVLSIQLCLVAYAVNFILFIIVYLLSSSSRPAFTKLQEHMSLLNGFAEERISGQKVVLAFMQEGRNLKEFNEISLQVAKTGGKATLIALFTVPISLFFANIQTIVLLLIGGLMVINGTIHLGLLVAFLGLSRSLTAPISQIFSSYSLLMSAQAGATRVFAILDEQPAVADKIDAPELPQISGDVRFDDVTFSYIPGRTILKKNTFFAKPGQVFGLCGPTGAGKSTILNILTRYYDIEKGSITVDGIKIDEIQQDSLRVQIAQVLQEPFLFSDTIMENLRYARRDATDEECIVAAKQAGADEFILAQPDGYQTHLTDGGANLSQGQRQMLTIARAMVAQPRLLILDEATSNVDTRTEKKIQAGLLELQRGKTSFIIAHRLSTISHADCILVINQGSIIERGTHDELMKKKSFYYTMYISQFRGKLSGFVLNDKT